jgi:low temperature requirement protein LtrA
MADESARVTSLELFFDLVFVFTITQLTTVLYHRASFEGWAQTALMLGLIWWMYDGYAWVTNTVRPDRLSRRLPLLAAMGAFLVAALAIPGAFHGSGATFGLAYLGIVLGHLSLFLLSGNPELVRSVRSLAPFNLATAVLVTAGGVFGGTAQYVLWALAFGIEWVTPLFLDDSGFAIDPRHFVERHGLVVIVAIGESVVAVGIGAAGLPIDAELVFISLVGLALSASLWWLYFAVDEDQAEAAYLAVPAAERPRKGIDAFGYGHLLILFGVIGVASAVKHAVGAGFDPLEGSEALALGLGVALFLLGDAVFRGSLRFGRPLSSAAAAVVALATIPIGSGVAAAAQITALVAVMVGRIAVGSGLAPRLG